MAGEVVARECGGTRTSPPAGGGTGGQCGTVCQGGTGGQGATGGQGQGQGQGNYAGYPKVLYDPNTGAASAVQSSCCVPGAAICVALL